MGRLVESPFRPAWWLRNPHLQTLWPTRFRPKPDLALSPERLELADGDFIDLLWTPDNGGPLVLVVHGLQGSLASHYSRTTLKSLHDSGFRSVFMHLRGCSGEPNRLDRSYHSGATEDLEAVLEHLRHCADDRPLAAVGFSLGGNLLLKHLGERGDQTPLRAGVAVSVPFRLMDAARRLELGCSRLYRRHLLSSLQTAYLRKFRDRPPPLAVDVLQLRDFYAFDDEVTAPLNGFSGADEYYATCSSRRFLLGITAPTLIIHALDDPFVFRETVPEEAELGPGVLLELSPHGGHVGFVHGTSPRRARYWTDERIPAFLQDRLKRRG